MLRVLMIIFFLVTSASATLNAASIPAFSVSGGTVDFMQFQFTIGDQFFTSEAITVTNLGAYSISGLAQSYPVGLWDSSGNLLASANVPASDLSDQFIYVPVTPVFLPASQYFNIGELVNSTATWLAHPLVQPAQQIGFGVGLYDNTNSPVLTDPLAPTVGFGAAFGPSFEFTFVPPIFTPEPATGWLIGIIAPVVLMLRRRIQ
jgi:hypothetical protein